MKLSAIFYVVLSTSLLILLILLVHFSVHLLCLLGLVVAGQLVVLLMVYKVLTDKYTTAKTFEDFYQDRDVKN